MELFILKPIEARTINHKNKIGANYLGFLVHCLGYDICEVGGETLGNLSLLYIRFDPNNRHFEPSYRKIKTNELFFYQTTGNL
jgi:hypothetical protein